METFYFSRFFLLKIIALIDYGDELAKKEKEPKNTEEKRKNIKSLIEKIPTDKASLFAHPVEWSLVDSVRHHQFCIVDGRSSFLSIRFRL